MRPQLFPYRYSQSTLTPYLILDTSNRSRHVPVIPARTRVQVFSQNVNGLGGRRDDKLEKLILLMIENSISAYYLQETW